MKVLAIESSTRTGSIALADGENTLAEISIAKSSEELAFSVEDILKKTATAKSQIGLIAVSAGPGFFTPLKTGAAAAKSFAYALGIPIAPVPSLEILACGAQCPPGTVICAAIDARSGMFFWALFRKENGFVRRLSEDRVTSPREMTERLEETSPHAFAVLQEDGSENPRPPGFTVQPSKASVCAKLGLRLMKEEKMETAFSFLPDYVRNDLYS